jgi:hypothetical protein
MPNINKLNKIRIHYVELINISKVKKIVIIFFQEIIKATSMILYRIFIDIVKILFRWSIHPLKTFSLIKLCTQF